jgi:hypothetical protein
VRRPQPAPYRAARELWAVRQLVGFGFQLPVRQFLQLTALASIVGILLLAAGGSLLVELGSSLLVGDDPRGSTGEATQLRVQEGLAVVAVVMASYIAVLDVGRASLTSLRVRVSESPLVGLWAALDIRRLEAVAAERAVGSLVRSAALAAFVAGAALQLARSGSPAAGDTLGLGIAVGVAHGTTIVGLALLHASRQARLVGRRWTWLAAAAPGLFLGLLLARMAPDGARQGQLRDRLLSFVLGFDGERWLQVMSLAVVVPVALGIATAVIGVVAAEQPARPIDGRSIAARASVHGVSSLAEVVEVGTGAARRSIATRRLLAAGAAVGAVIVGWRLGGGGHLPGAERADRALALYAVFTAAVVSSTAVAVAGQNPTLNQLRYLWEQGLRPVTLYGATVLVAVRRAVPLQITILVMAVAAWGTVPWRALLVVVAVVLGDFLVDSVFARPRAAEGNEAADPVVAVASIGLLLVLGALAFWSGPVAATALVVLTLSIGVTGPWMFRSRLRRVAVVAA